MSVLESEIVKLSTKEKIELAEKLWETIDIETSHSLTRGQESLLNERLKEHANNPTEGKSWEQVRKPYKTD